MSSEDKGRLARWAHRKEAARRRRGSAATDMPEESAAVPATTPTPVGTAKSESEDAGQPAPDLDLPDVETLTEGSDFTVFMKDGVPAKLRRLALRKLWASDPMFNVIDEMVEYGEDYTDSAMVVEGMKSAWEAGRGYAKKAIEEGGDEADAQDDADDREPVAPEEISADERPPEDEGTKHG
jgi:hypothetical protein